MPPPNWFTAPLPVISADSVMALLWLKLIAPVPKPKVMVGLIIVPALSLPPSEPMFSVPAEVLVRLAILISVTARVPPLATVTTPFPPSLAPIASTPLLVQREPAPVIKASVSPDCSTHPIPLSPVE